MHWLALVLMLLVAVRPLLLLACDAHEQQHLELSSAEHPYRHDVVQRIIESSGEAPTDPHALTHLHACCGHGHFCPAALIAPSSPRVQFSGLVRAAYSTSLAQWTGLNPFRPPIVA
jgi:hypothetical protein